MQRRKSILWALGSGALGHAGRRASGEFRSLSGGERHWLADALSTAAFVPGLEEGTGLVRSTPGADACLVTKTRRVVLTEGFDVGRRRAA